MKKEKRIMVLFGLGVLLMVVPAGTFAGQWFVDNTFTDDFNRADVTWTFNLGPGWLSGTNSTTGAFTDRWDIASQTAVRRDGGSSAWATNFVLGRCYQIGVDLKWKLQDAFGLFGNLTYMGTNSRVAVIHQPFLKRIMLRVYDNAGGYLDFGYQTAASLTVDAWYRFTLSRSNSYVRSTFVGADANLDTGWLTNYMEHIGSGGNGGISMNNTMYFDNFSLTNYKYVEKGTIISIR